LGVVLVILKLNVDQLLCCS